VLGAGFRFGNALLVAVGAAHPVDVVGALCIGEGSVHLLDVDAAMGHLRMAGLAGCCRFLIVASVAGEATDAFVDTHGGAVVAGGDLRSPMTRGCKSAVIGDAGCVALVADGLALIGTDLYRSGAIEELREWELRGGEVQLLATIVEGEGRRDRRGRGGDPRIWLSLDWTFAMHLVTGRAGHSGFIG